MQTDILVVTDVLDSMFNRETKDFNSNTEAELLPLSLLADLFCED